MRGTCYGNTCTTRSADSLPTPTVPVLWLQQLVGHRSCCMCFATLDSYAVAVLREVAPSPELIYIPVRVVLICPTFRVPIISLLRDGVDEHWESFEGRAGALLNGYPKYSLAIEVSLHRLIIVSSPQYIIVQYMLACCLTTCRHSLQLAVPPSQGPATAITMHHLFGSVGNGQPPPLPVTCRRALHIAVFRVHLDTYNGSHCSTS